MDPSPEKPRRSHRVRSLNLTSMLDVCFLLLIFFILTAAFEPNEGVLDAAPVGKSFRSDRPPDERIKIYLSSFGGDDVAIRLDVDRRSFTSFSELHGRLARLKRAVYGPQTHITLVPDGRVSWQNVINAFNQAKRAGFDRVDFADPA